MAKINVLKKEVSDLIAAGEVVERPASVIKELVENSIDAGAKSITVEIRNGGTTYMRVTDDGCGISREDVPLAFVSHATSKVLTADDLENIMTLGFRGEALASVCAVSRTEMLTRCEGDEIGTRCAVESGEMVEIDDAGCPKGTTIVVRNLFFNVPARMKFLKKDVSEANTVHNVLLNIAISHPEISIKFIRDGKITLQTAGDGKLISVIYSVFGKEFAQSMIEVSYELSGVRIYGYVGKPQNARPNRTMQHFFVNGRMVKSPLAARALEEAYKGSIMVGKFPCCVLNISVSPMTVDVNVHPTKTQVRFVNEKAIFEAVYFAGKNALKSGDTVKEYHSSRPSDPVSRAAVREFTENLYKSNGQKQESLFSSDEKKDKKDDFWQRRSSSDIYSSLHDGGSRYSSNGYKNPQNSGVKPPEIKVETVESYGKDKTEETKKPETPSLPKDERKDEPKETAENKNKNDYERDEVAVPDAVPDKKDVPAFRVIGEAFRTYIIVELEKELLLFDKHACHERIIYERLKANMTTPESQLLLTPLSITLSREEYDAAMRNIDSFAALGFEIEDFGQGTVIVRAVPAVLQDENIESTVAEIAGYLSKNKNELETRKMDWILHSAACRAAIKSGDFTSEYEMNLFVAELLQRDDIRYCPHGRPVCISMPKREIEKNFGRI